MRAFLAVLAAWLLSATLASAQMMGISGGPFTVGSTYTGPGNQSASFTAWYSCTRGYSTAYATGSNKGCNLRRASDSTTQDILILANGNFDSATANTFAGTDATASCSSATTTLTCTGASSTPHVGSTITGAGYTQPCVATAVGTFTGGAGTLTTNGCGTVSVAVTVTLQYGLYVTKAYDQTAANACATASCDLTQPTTGAQPQWLPNGGNGLPTTQFATSAFSLFSNTNFTPASGVTSFQLVFNRYAGTTNWSIGSNGVGASSNRLIGGNGVANAVTLGGGSSGTFNATASDAAWHSVGGVINGASPASVVNVDGTETTGTTAGNTSAGVVHFNGNTSVDESEWGFSDNVAWSGTVRTNLCHNGRLYYSTPGSC